MSNQNGWLSPDQLEAWNAFMSAAQLLQRRIDVQFERDGDLTQVQYELLHHLSTAEDEGLMMAELADRSVTTRSGLSYQVDNLEARGLVERRRDPADGRRISAFVTREGVERLEATAPGHARIVRDGLFDVLNEAETKQLAELMKRVSKHLSQGQ